MLKLVWKDVVAAGWFLLATVPLYVVQLAGMAEIAPAMILVTVLFTAAFAFGSIGIEEVQGTEPTWCSLPVSRGDVVAGRYLSTAAGVFFGLGTSWLIGRAAAVWIFADPEHAPRLLGTGAYATLFAMFLLCAALFLPCYYRFGVGRGLALFSLLLLAAVVLLSALGSLIVHLAGGEDTLMALRDQDPERLAAVRHWLDRRGGMVAAGLAAVASLGFGASAALSARFYASRDC